MTFDGKCDFSKLEKGKSYLPPTYLEHKFQISRESKKYRLCLLELTMAIRLARPDLEAHVKNEDDGIRIMNDSEAEEYTWRHMTNDVSRMSRRVDRRTSIDRAQLSAEMRAVAFSHDQHATALVIAAKNELKRADRDALFAAKIVHEEGEGDQD